MNRRHSVPRTAAALVLAAAIGCSTLSVDTDWDPEVDFGALHTYAWRPGPQLGDPRVDHSLLENRVHRAVNRVLATKGYQHKGTGVPDFYVSYIAAIQSKLDVRILNDYYGYRPGWGTYQRDTYVREYDEGSLILDISDPTSSNLMWRGSAAAEIHLSGTPAERQQVVSRAVERILASFPPEAAQR